MQMLFLLSFVDVMIRTQVYKAKGIRNRRGAQETRTSDNYMRRMFLTPQCGVLVPWRRTVASNPNGITVWRRAPYQ